jgi:hypothetical protein
MITQSYEIRSIEISPINIGDKDQPQPSRTIDIQLASGEEINIILYGPAFRHELLKIKGVER